MKSVAKRRFRKSVRSTILCGLLVPGGLLAADWPQLRGPDRDGKSVETGLLRQWPEGGPPLAWKISGLGGGYSAPSIVAGRIHGMSNRGEAEVVWALAEADGAELWATPLGTAYTEGMPQGREGTGCTPTVDGDRLYVLGLGGDLACLQAADGSILWRRSLTNDFGGRLPTWRYNESPLVHGDHVLCTPGGIDATLVALDKMSGEEIWRCRVPEEAEGGGGFGRRSGASYASPIAVNFDGQWQYIQLAARALIGVAASDGTLLWQYDRPANRASINCAMPVYHDGMVFASSAYGAGGGLVKLSRDPAGGVTAEEVYATRELQNHHGGMILVDGHLYGANGGNEGGFLVCLDFQSGNVLWDGREVDEPRPPKGSLTFADGRLYCRGEDGTMVLVEPNPTRYVAHGRFEQPDRSGQPAWPYPVIANGKLYLRDQDVLLCYDIRTNPAPAATP